MTKSVGTKRAKTMHQSSAKWLSAFGISTTESEQAKKHTRRTERSTTGSSKTLVPTLARTDPFRVPAHAIREMVQSHLNQLERDDRYNKALLRMYRSMQLYDMDGIIIPSEDLETDYTAQKRVAFECAVGRHIEAIIDNIIEIVVEFYTRSGVI